MVWLAVTISIAQKRTGPQKEIAQGQRARKGQGRDLIPWSMISEPMLLTTVHSQMQETDTESSGS